MDFSRYVEWVTDNREFIFGSGGSILGLCIWLFKKFFGQKNKKKVIQKAKAGKKSTIVQVNGNINIGGNHDQR